MATAAVNGKRMRETPPSIADADRNVRLMFDLDLDILECPICTEFLSPPVFQCPNGHPICSACHVKVSTCPSCSKPIGATRNLLAEKILESLQVRCEHAAHGCKIMLQYSKREEHIKKLCAYRPCPCPVPGCKHEGRKQTLAQHLDCNHQVQTATLRWSLVGPGIRDARLQIRTGSRFWLLKFDEKVQLLLHIEPIETFGYLFYCTTFEDYAIKYDLEVRNLSEMRVAHHDVQGFSRRHSPHRELEERCSPFLHRWWLSIPLGDILVAQMMSKYKQMKASVIFQPSSYQ